MHWLVAGESGTGKTFWAKTRVLEAAAAGKNCLILDPFNDEWGQDEAGNGENGHGLIRVTTDRTEFLKWFWASELGFCVIDESAVSAPRGDEEMIETAIMGRHQGHICSYLCQRVAQVHPTIRGQCSHLVVFGCSARDAKLLSEEFDNDGLYEARDFPAGQFLYLQRRHEIKREKLF